MCKDVLLQQNGSENKTVVHMFIRSVGGAFQMYERQKDKGNIKLKKDRHKQKEFSTTWHFKSCLLRGFITDKALEN